MSQSNKSLGLAIGAAIAAGSLFSMQAMAHGYMQDAPAMAKSDKASEGSCGMAKMDADKDGRLSRTEFNAAHKGSEVKFAGYDSDGDGFVTQAEMDAHHASMKKDDSKGMKDSAMKKMKAEGKCGEGKCGSK